MEINTLQHYQPKSPTGIQSWLDELDYIGDLRLLDASLLAIFSSAKCPASLILKAHDYAQQMKNRETGIISGFHSPAEREILTVLLKGVCPIVVVMGRRLENARIPAVWKTEIEKDRMLIISPFSEKQIHITKEIALKRNDLAARIARRVVIVHASEGGKLQVQAEIWKKEGIGLELLS